MIAQDALPILSLLFLPARRLAARSQAEPGQTARTARGEAAEVTHGARRSLGSLDWTRADRERYAALLREEGLELPITVRTGALAQDLDLLAALDRRHAVTVRMHLPAIDERIAAAQALAAEGLDVRLILSPLRPGVNDGVAALRRFVAAARSTGATDVELGPAQHRGLFGRWVARPAAPHVRALFERLRLEYGFPRSCAGRG